MAIDNTELSFIRCPSCRSLVSALSKTCRMCGAGLTAATPKKEESAEPKESRVRQATYADSGELTQAAHQLRQDTKVKDAVVNEDISPDDPLSAFVTEIEEPESAVPTPEEAPEFEAQYEEEFSQSPVMDDTGDDEEDDYEVDDDGMVILKSKEDAGAQASLEEELVEEPISAAAPKHTPWPAEGMKAAMQSRPVTVAPSKSTPSMVTQPPSPVAPSRHEEPEYEAVSTRVPAREEPPKVAVAPVAAIAPSSPPVQPTTVAKQPTSLSLSGERALCGWLVDLSKNGGVAIELREGRFFVTQQKLKELDLIIDEPTISSPHALVAVSAAKGIKMQDLMSEDGVFLCRHGETEFVQMVETIELAHGDRIRFGAVEYLVCVVARP